MKARQAKPNKVLLILRTTESGREILQGALQYARADPYCSVQMELRPDALTPEKVASFESAGYDGILTSEIGMSEEVTRAFTELNVPMVVMSAPDPRLVGRTQNIAFVGLDESGIGALGAQHFRSLGSFNSYGFVASYRGLPWSDLRKQGFADEAKKHSADVRTFDGPERFEISFTSSDETRRLENWLLNLPKPAAIMADHDARAAQVLECCRRLGIKVPEQVSVLGVDNDRVICDFTEPTLSSVLPDHEQVGFRAAARLNVMMRRRKTAAAKPTRCPPRGIVARDSTRPLSPSGRLVQRALVFIDQHACEGIRVTDVVKHLQVSRALADLRFREIENKSILEAILDRRLAEVTRLLLTTDDSLVNIALRCGFPNPKHLKHLFKSRFGLPMSEYRASHAAN